LQENRQSLFYYGGFRVNQDKKVDVGVGIQLAAAESAYGNEGETGGKFGLQAGGVSLADAFLHGCGARGESCVN
jgi:hypothetical protein